MANGNVHLNEQFERPAVFRSFFLFYSALFFFVFMWQLLKAEPKASHPFRLLCIKRMIGFYCFAHMIMSCAPGLARSSRAGVMSEEVSVCLPLPDSYTQQLHLSVLVKLPYQCVTLIT